MSLFCLEGFYPSLWLHDGTSCQCSDLAQMPWFHLASTRSRDIHWKGLYFILIYTIEQFASCIFLLLDHFGTSDGQSSSLYQAEEKQVWKLGPVVPGSPHFSFVTILYLSFNEMRSLCSCLFLVTGSLPLLVLHRFVLSASLLTNPSRK
jgi:hypothetical protein